MKKVKGNKPSIKYSGGLIETCKVPYRTHQQYLSSTYIVALSTGVASNSVALNKDM